MRYILTSMFLLCASIGMAQSSGHFGLFPTVDHSGTISNKVDYSLYYFAGFNLINTEVNGIKDPANFFVIYSEQALSYKLNTHFSLTGSYVYERQRPTSSLLYRNESRFYLQGTYIYNLAHSAFKHRLRYDGRFIQNRLTSESPYTSRVRYLFGITTPLQKNADKLYLSAYNELFFNSYKATPTLYSENWAYAAVGMKTKHAGNFEVGPLYIFWVNNAQHDLTNFLYLQLTWVSHVDLRKNKTGK